MNPEELLKIIRELEAFKANLDSYAVMIGNVIVELKTLLPITGFIVDPLQKGSVPMPVLKVKKGINAVRKWAKTDKPHATEPIAITNDPNNPGHWVAHLVNLAGDVLDASAVATFHGVADASGNLTETDEPPVNFATQGNKAGPATVAGTVTANDGSFTFSRDIGFVVNPGGPSGFQVDPA